MRQVVNTATGVIIQKIDYDEYGNILSDSNPNFQPFAYAGGLYETQTKLVRFGARDYAAGTGRWTAKDPVGFECGSSNLFAYSNLNPINLKDSKGQWAEVVTDIILAIVDLANYNVESAVDRAKDVGITVVAAGIAGTVFGSVGKQLVKKVFSSKIVNTILNQNRYFRLGLGRKGGRQVLRIAGKFLKAILGKGKIDILDLGPL